MGSRGEALTQRFEQTNEAVIAAVQACSDEQWNRTCSDEQWSVGVTAHHIASSHQPLAEVVQRLAIGQPLPPLTSELIDAGNAEHARQYAGCTREETVELLRQGARQAAKILRGLTDQQLDNGAQLALLNGQRMTAAEFAELVLIGHPANHLESIRAAA